MPRIYKQTAKNVDLVVFNGVNYRRYPDSDRSHLRRYYSRSGGRGFLHRDVWEFHNGPIPEGYVIHHVDENHLNNDISNLVCIPKAEHAAHQHAKQVEQNRSEKQKAHLASIRTKASAWHKSEEGRTWHAQNAKAAWVGREPVHCQCQQCGDLFGSVFSDAQYCSKSCQNKAWYAAHPDYGAQKRARAAARRLQPEC